MVYMTSNIYIPITEHPIPDLLPDQLSKFTTESIHAESVSAFDPQRAIASLESREGERFIGADFGGDKGLTKLFKVHNGSLLIDDSYSDYVQSTHGDGYLESLEKTADFARKHDIPVGISWGAPLDGTRPLYHPKIDHFIQDLSQKYSGDFKNIMSELKACVNDGIAGLVSGIVEASQNKRIESVLFAINGGGLGMAALAHGKLYSTEAGHVEAVEALGANQGRPCGVYGETYQCLEQIGGNKSGIEAQWEKRNGYLRAIDIEGKFKSGDIFSGELYDQSAFVVAHMIMGTALALGVDISQDSTAVVCHGGGFKFPDYSERVQQILAKYIGTNPMLINTHDYGLKETNACLDGAALIAAIGYDG